MSCAPDLRFVLPEKRARVGVAAGGAGLVHLAFVILLTFTVWVRPDRLVRAIQPHVDPPSVVWIASSDPGGGGGGGGNRMITERPKATDVPAVKPSEPIPTAVAEPAPPPEPVRAAEIPAIPTEAPVAALATAPTASPALGPGDAGAGSKGSDGIGPGDHRGLGPGERPGTGPGNGRSSGVSQPTLVYGPKPRYTAEAVMKRLQGEVHLECEALATGLVGMCRVIKSLDANAFGLDNEALRTAGLFVFKPAMRSGEPVAALVRIVLEFNLR
jgi:protein TonB